MGTIKRIVAVSSYERLKFSQLFSQSLQDDGLFVCDQFFCLTCRVFL